MPAPRLGLLAALVAVAAGTVLAPAGAAADAKPPKDAVTPSKIELIVGKLRDDRFGATGYMEFSEPVTGTAYGHWIISNGVVRDRVSFRLANLTDTNSTPFSVVDRKVHMSGRTLTAVLKIGTTRSNRITLIQ